MSKEGSEALSVAFDARQLFYKELMERLNRAQVFCIQGALVAWRDELHGIFSLLAPFISEDHRVLLSEGNKEKKILGLWDLRDRLENNTTMTDAAWKRLAASDESRELRKLLFRLQTEMMCTAKHMLLPFRDDSERKINIDSFMDGTQ